MDQKVWNCGPCRAGSRSRSRSGGSKRGETQSQSSCHKKATSLASIKTCSGLKDVKPVYLLNLYASAMDASLLTVAQTPSFTGYDKSTWYLLKDEMSRRGWKVWHPKFPEEKDRIWLPSCEFKRRMLIFRQYERKRFFEQSSGQVRYV
jgi:hypothetical protein